MASHEKPVPSTEESNVSRRSFLAAGVAGTASTLSAAAYARVQGANERVGMGFVGYGLIGKRHVIDFQEQSDVNMAAVCDVHRGRLDEAARFIGGEVRPYGDFRELLDNRQVDAVVVSTPDHWHALIAMMACAAGKDVYVEKPMTLFVREGRWMADVAKKHGRVVQVGTQQRSGEHYQRAKTLIQDGHIGKIVSVRAQAARNIMPGYGDPPTQSPPDELDYNLWLGPAPLKAYNANRAIYHFRWFWDYSGGQMTNLGQHSFDIVDMILGVQGLKSVYSTGGRLALEDNGETPDVQDALFEFDGWTAAWYHRECSRGLGREWPLEFYGTKGSLGIGRDGFVVTADRDIPPPNTVPQFTGAHPVGGPRPVKETGPPRYKTRPVTDESGDDRAQFKQHARNFLDCIKSRHSPISDVESGHRVATMCHLANLSLRLGRRLAWDAENETIIGDEEATSMLVRPYRSPWNKVLDSLLS
ncbi:MAG: Gfo/Idh/MocA family oxidoreductase [Pirellulaceae bacterium]